MMILRAGHLIYTKAVIKVERLFSVTLSLGNEGESFGARNDDSILSYGRTIRFPG